MKKQIFEAVAFDEKGGVEIHSCTPQFAIRNTIVRNDNL